MDITNKINEIALKFFEGNNVRFAEKMGTSEANIRNYRSKSSPKIDFLVRMCNEFEISFDWIFNDEGPMKRRKSSESVIQEEAPRYGLGPDIENYKRTIQALEKTISAQEKTINTLEKLLEPKTGNKGARELSNPSDTWTEQGQLEKK